MLCASSTSIAGLILSPTAVTSPEITLQGALGQIIDQSGITPFVSGVTDFDVYAPSTVENSTNITSGGWFGGPTKAEMTSSNPGEIAFDLGSIVNITRVAYWQTVGGTSLSAVTIYSDTDNDFTNGTTANLGSFSPADSLLGNVLDVTDASTRYLQFQWTNIHATNSSFLGGLGEFAVEVDPRAAVPEPTTIALLTLGLAGIGFSRRKAT